MYNIGYCKICKQGLLEIAKDKLTKKYLYVVMNAKQSGIIRGCIKKGINGTKK